MVLAKENPMTMNEMKRQVEKDAKANGHKLRWFAAHLPKEESQQAVCEHCLAGVSCTTNGEIACVKPITYTRGIDGKETMKKKCADVIAEIEKDMSVYKE